MTSFLRNRRTPKIWNPREQATKLTINQIEADEIISVITNSQQFQQQTSSGVPQNIATTTYVDNSINNSATNIRNSILNGAGPAFDTLKELQTELEGNDSAISAITSSLANKANKSYVDEVFYNRIETDAKFGTLTQIDDLQSQIYTNTSNISTNTGNISSLTSSVNSLNAKTTNLTVNPDTGRLTINSRLSVTAGSNGLINIGDQPGDTTTITGNLNLQNANVSGLNKNSVGLSNVDNTSDLNKEISNATQSALNLKADKTQIITAGKWVVNNGVNMLSSVLSSIGSSTSQVIEFSGGTHNDTVNPNVINALNTVLIGQYSGSWSPVSILNYGLTISGSNMTRYRMSNFGVNGNVIIDGTQGQHDFNNVSFRANLTFLNSTTNFISFTNCSFAGAITVPNTFAGLIQFLFCNFSGATINFNQSLNQQIYIFNSVNLPSLNLNALLNGQNIDITGNSNINTVSFNCSGSMNLQSNSISQSSVNNLTSDLNSKLNITDANNTYATISNLTTTNNNLTTTNTNLSNLTNRVDTNETNITNLQQKTNVLNYDGVSDTLTINSKLSVVKDTSSNSGQINLGDGIGTDIINIRSNISSNSQTITPTQLGFISGLSSNAQTQLNNRVTIGTTQTISGQKNFTGGIELSGVNLNTRLTAIETTNTNQDASISSINTSITDLQNNKANITYVDTQLANLVNSAPESLNQLNELASALGNNPNYATDMVNALALKANDNAVVKLSGDQTITGIKNFSTIELSGTNLNTRISNIETVNNTQNTDITNLQQKTNVLSYDSGTDTLSISSKVNISKDLTDTASIYLGDNIGNDIIYLRGNLNVLGTTNITPTELSRLSGITSGIQSQLNSRVTTNTTQTVSGLKNFTGGVQLNGTDLNTRITAIETTNTNQDSSISTINSSITDLQNNKQNNLTFDNTPTNNSTNILNSGSIFNTLTNYYDKTESDNKFATITSLNSGLSGKQNTLTFDSSPTNGSTNPVQSGGVFTALSSYLTTSSASSTYQTISGMSSYLTSSTASATYQTISGMSSYLTSSTASATYQTISGMSSFFGLSSNNSISGRNTFTNMNTFNRVCESVNQAGSGTNLSLNFDNITGGIIFYAPSANYTLSLTNIPTTNTNCIYTLTLRYSTRFFANALNINGSAITMTAIGGFSNLSINSSASFVYQQIQIVFNSSSVPTATTCLLSIW